VAYLNGQAITNGQLFERMLEAHGGEALAELLLDRAVAKRLDQEGLDLTDDDILAERQRLLSSLDPDPDQAARLLRQMRETRGLGKQRYSALLKRNAGLRRLVSSSIKVGEPAIQLAYKLRYGQRYEVRLITADSVDTLSRARQRALNGESYTALAIELSTDTSVRQGGLLSPISPADAAYPKAVRDALSALSLEDAKTRLSPVIALPEGYALLWLENIISKDAPPIEQVRGELEQAVRLELQRVRMQQLARVLIEEANVVMLDPALEKAWRLHRDSLLAP